MTPSNHSFRLIAACIVLGCTLPVVAQVPDLRKTPSQPVRVAPKVTAPPVRLLPPNVTRWGIVERQGGQVYGKTGQTVFIEGRDLDPKALVLELRDGARAVPFPRRPGGSSARVEFTIPPQAVTGDLTYTLQAVQGGTRVLATDFGVCDRVGITSISPNEIHFDHRSANVNREYSLEGKILTIAGSCLQELVLARVNNRPALTVGTPAGAITVTEEVSRSFGRMVLKLNTYVPPSAGASGSRGPVRLVAPQTGPVITVAALAEARPEPAPAAEPLSVIRISRFEGEQSWGFPDAIRTPFVVTQTDTEDLASPNGPKRWNNFVRVFGDNLSANTNTVWRIGNVEIGRPFSVSGDDVRLRIPANAVTAPICAVRRDGARFCSKLSLPVAAGPRIVQTPPGWPRNGDLNPSTPVTARVRQVQVISGFDLVPRGDPNLSAELVVTNYDAAAARACNLDFRVLRLDANRIEFSFGTPGTTRPPGCTADQERRVNFVTPASGTNLPGQVQLTLLWRYQGRSESIAAWRVHGAL